MSTYVEAKTAANAAVATSPCGRAARYFEITRLPSK
jgi:hypothetical protein